jgi:hypothetical protein
VRARLSTWAADLGRSPNTCAEFADQGFGLAGLASVYEELFDRTTKKRGYWAGDHAALA